MIPHATQLDAILELGVPENFAADGVSPDVLRVDADGLRLGVDADDAWAEALLEFVGELGWDGLLDFDVGEEAVRGGG